MKKQIEKPVKNPIGSIRVIGNVTKILAKIISTVTFVAFCLTLLGGIVLCCLPQGTLRAEVTVSAKAVADTSEIAPWLADLVHVEGMEQTDTGRFHLRFIDTGLSLDGEQRSYSVTSRQFGGALICVAFSLLLFSAVFYFVSAFGKTLHTVDSPFCMECVSGLQKIAISALVWSFGCAVLNGISNAILKEAAVFLDMSVNSGSILFALALLGFAYVFRYGVTLQREADTTL